MILLIIAAYIGGAIATAARVTQMYYITEERETVGHPLISIVIQSLVWPLFALAIFIFSLAILYRR